MKIFVQTEKKLSQYNALSEELSEELRNLYFKKRIQRIKFEIMFKKNKNILGHL